MPPKRTEEEKQESRKRRAAIIKERAENAPILADWDVKEKKVPLKKSQQDRWPRPCLQEGAPTNPQNLLPVPEAVLNHPEHPVRGLRACPLYGLPSETRMFFFPFFPPPSMASKSRGKRTFFYKIK